MRPGRAETALFAACFAVAALVGLTLVWADRSAYPLLAPQRSGLDAGAELARRLTLHSAWVDFVTGRAAQQPAGGGFTDDERRHMDDVRTVFVAAQAASLVALVGLAVLAVRARRRGALARLARNGALGAALLVAAVGAFAALAFDAAFTLFHEVFFPQGNWSFPPGSELLRIYPAAYFYGIAIAISVSFLALAAAVVAAGHLAASRGSAR
ncbi:MAG TPA: DUF1461 domain-containing protein [Candidatus Limnocylindria bacterium]|nr:DUF1461 domain-containing protein [Candidatus Limnocylindria bacterium]